MDQTRRALSTIVIAGLVAGTLDAIAAMLLTYFSAHRPPLAVFRFIASGGFGQAAFDSNYTVMTIAGIFFHYFIATTWAAIMYFIYPYVKLNKYVAGLLYGIAIWLVMNLAVLPLSNIPKGNGIKLQNALMGAGILMIAVGLPIVLIVHRKRSSKTSPNLR